MEFASHTPSINGVPNRAGGHQREEDIAEDDSLLPRAFAVDREMAPDDGVPPTSGLDYLRRVRWEANRCPDVVVSDVDTQAFANRQTVFAPRLPDLIPAPPGLAPRADWEATYLRSFAHLHQVI
jgi:survival of motor neuron protein-interacting protein 1